MNQTFFPMHEDSHIAHHFHEKQASRRNTLTTTDWISALHEMSASS